MPKKTILLSSIFIFIIIAGLLYTFSKYQQSKIQPLQIQTEKPAPETSTQTIKFYFEPNEITLSRGEESTILLKALFTPQDTNTTLEYLKTEINIPTSYVIIPEDYYVVTQDSQFNTIVRVDGPEIINETGRITIELTTDSLVSGPLTSEDLTIAKIIIRGRENTPNSTKMDISRENTQVTNNKTQTLKVIDSDPIIIEVIDSQAN